MVKKIIYLSVFLSIGNVLGGSLLQDRELNGEPLKKRRVVDKFSIDYILNDSKKEKNQRSPKTLNVDCRHFILDPLNLDAKSILLFYETNPTFIECTFYSCKVRGCHATFNDISKSDVKRGGLIFTLLQDHLLSNHLYKGEGQEPNVFCDCGTICRSLAGYSAHNTRFFRHLENAHNSISFKSPKNKV